MRVETKNISAAHDGQRQAFGLVLACLITVLAVFYQTFVEMLRIWHRSDTFAHGYLVLPAFLYFTWLRSAELASLAIKPVLSVTLLAAAVGFVWLLGDLSSSLTPSFFAMIAMVPLVVLGVLGWRWATALAFPLAFLLFAVPFGEAFVPTLIEWTANFTVAALSASGIPVYREGPNFVTPNGNWSVVDACSGVRYLIASMFVGVIYAWQIYRSPLRRALFFLASIAVPIVANWLRAYIIVMLAHHSDSRVAAGVDHLIYGWIFFGVVMVMLFAVGAIWREDRATESEIAIVRTPTPGDEQHINWPSIGRASAVMLAALLAWPLLALALSQPQADRPLPNLTLEPTAGWQAAIADSSEWQPKVAGAAQEYRLGFDKDGQRVNVFLAVYRNQRQGAELVSSANRLLGDDIGRWLPVAAAPRGVNLNGEHLVVRAEQLRGIDGSIVSWQWYWLRNVRTASDSRAKLELAIDRLLRRDDTSVWISVYMIGGDDLSKGERALHLFLNEMGDSLKYALRSLWA